MNAGSIAAISAANSVAMMSMMSDDEEEEYEEESDDEEDDDYENEEDEELTPEQERKLGFSLFSWAIAGGAIVAVLWGLVWLLDWMLYPHVKGAIYVGVGWFVVVWIIWMIIGVIIKRNRRENKYAY